MDLRPDPLHEKLERAVDAALSGTGDPMTELAVIGVPALSLPAALNGYELGMGADVVVNFRLGYGLEPLAAYRETVMALALVDPYDVPDTFLEDALDGAAHAAAIGLSSQATLRLDAAGRLWGSSEGLPDGKYEFIVARTVAPGGEARWAILVPDETIETVAELRLGLPYLRLSFHGSPAHPIRLKHGVLEAAVQQARVRQAAVLLGIADRALALARTHVNRRRQYGAPLLNLQTVAHRLARLVGVGEGWQLALHEIASRFDRGINSAGEGTQALAIATQHALECTRLGIQLSGVRGVLAHSTAAMAYRVASVEGSRVGPPAMLWIEAGRQLIDDFDLRGQIPIGLNGAAGLERAGGRRSATA